MVLTILYSLALASPHVDRWSDSTWGVATEVFLPQPIALPAPSRLETAAIQVRALLRCDRGEVKRRRARVRCTIEDIALQAHLEPGSRLSALEALDRALTGAEIGFLARSDGRLRDISVEAPLGGTGPERENVRRLMGRVLAGFDLKMPRSETSPQWVEYDAALVELPFVAESGGTSLVIHERSSETLRTLGEGSLTVGIEALRVRLTGVGHVGAAGWLEERAWALTSRVTGESLYDKTYRHAGRFMSRPIPLGPTRAVAWPGEVHRTLPTWQAIDE